MGRRDRTPLVELEHGDALAAVVRDDDGWLLLTGDVRRRGGAGVSDYGAHVEGWPDHWVVGGALAPRATRAQVLADSGEWVEAKAANGAWVAVLAGPTLDPERVVRYLDEEGAIVKRPLPPGTELEPVADASEPCVACGASDWKVARGSLEMLVPAGWQDEPDEHEREQRTAVCGRCGHQEPVGASVSISLDDPDPSAGRGDLAPGKSEGAERALAEPQPPLDDAGFTVYGLDSSWGGARSIGGAAGIGNQLDCVTLDHARRNGPEWVSVTTAVRDELDWSPEERAAEAYGRFVAAAGPWPRSSEEALAVWLSARDRDARRAAAVAARRKAEITVDGRAVTFAVMGSDQRWAGAADHRTLSLTIEAAGVAPHAVRLVPVDDPSAYS